MKKILAPLAVVFSLVAMTTHAQAYVQTINTNTNITAASPLPIKGVYTSPSPNISPNAETELHVDNNGNLNVNVQKGGGALSAIYSSPQPSLSPGATSSLSLDQNANLNVNVQAFPVSTPPPAVNGAVTIGTSSTVIFTANSTRRGYRVCDPLIVYVGGVAVTNNQVLWLDEYGNSAVAGSPDQEILPGVCWGPDYVPASSSQISALASPFPGATPTSVPAPAQQQ